MKVIHVLNHFLPENVAGTEVYVWSLCKQLQKSGCDVTVVIPNYQSEVSAEYKYDEIPVFKYAEPSVANREVITGKKPPEGLPNFSQFLKLQKPDIVHFHEIAGSNGVGVAHFEAAKTSGAKVIFTIHLSGNTCRTGTLMYKGAALCDGVISDSKCGYCALKNKISTPLVPELLSLASTPFYALGINPIKWQNPLGTALSYSWQIKKLRDDLLRIVKSTDMILPITHWYHKILLENGVPKEKMKVVLQALPFSPADVVTRSVKQNDTVNLIFVGRIDALKGIDVLIKAAEMCNNSRLRIDIYGNAPDKKYLEDCKNKTKDLKGVNWKGILVQKDVVATMSSYDALVLPSMFSEMSPLVIQEAFAAGIPVIGSNVYGIAEQVKDKERGLLFQFGDPASLAGVFNKICNDVSLLRKMAASISTPRKFEEVASETMSIYRKVFNKVEIVS